MSCPCCEWTEEDARETVKLAYGAVPENGELLRGEEIQRFARRVIEDAIKLPSILSGLGR